MEVMEKERSGLWGSLHGISKSKELHSTFSSPSLPVARLVAAAQIPPLRKKKK